MVNTVINNQYWQSYYWIFFCWFLCVFKTLQLDTRPSNPKNHATFPNAHFLSQTKNLIPSTTICWQTRLRSANSVQMLRYPPPDSLLQLFQADTEVFPNQPHWPISAACPRSVPLQANPETPKLRSVQSGSQPHPQTTSNGCGGAADLFWALNDQTPSPVSEARPKSLKLISAASRHRFILLVSAHSFWPQLSSTNCISKTICKLFVKSETASHVCASLQGYVLMFTHSMSHTNTSAVCNGCPTKGHVQGPNSWNSESNTMFWDNPHQDTQSHPTKQILQ